MAGGPGSRRSAHQRGAAGSYLQRAIDAYLGVYRAEPARHLWHGINAAALAARAVRDNVSLREALDGSVLAARILAAVEGKEDPDAWDFATAAEACLAVGRTDEALQWVARYVVRPEADAFELASTLRQMKEVWGLTIEAPPGSLLLPLLQSQLLLRSGGRVDLAAGEVTPTIRKTEERVNEGARLEKVLGKEGMVSLSWYRLGLERSQVVAKILDKVGDGFGTGFLVRGGDLLSRLGDAVVLLTNAHVVSDDAAVQARYKSLDPDDATIAFEGLEAAAGQRFRVKDLLWTSPPTDLDATLVRLDRPVPPCPAVSIAKRLPSLDGAQKIYVIGHPGGRSMSVSLNDNLRGRVLCESVEP